MLHGAGLRNSSGGKRIPTGASRAAGPRMPPATRSSPSCSRSPSCCRSPPLSPPAPAFSARQGVESHFRARFRRQMRIERE